MSSDRKKGDPSQSAEQKRKESEEQLSLLQMITRQLAAAEDVSSALKIVLRQICEKTGWALGQPWVPNKDGSVLVCDSDWFSGGGDLQEFRVASERIHFKPGVGLPGRVWESKQAAWIEDVRQDPNFPRTIAAKSVGLKTAVGIPILSGDKVIAVIEFFMRESRSENEQLVRVIVAVAANLDLVMERKRAAEELSRTNEILRSILSDMGDAVIVADTDENFLLFNPAAERMFGAGATKTNASEWSHRYGLYLPDKITLFPHEQLPLIRSIHGEEVNNVEMFVRHEKAVDGAPIGPRNGSCGTAMYTRRPVVVTDVIKDPLWTDYRELAQICGLRACWSTPILSWHGEVLGSFAMYRQETRGPQPEEMRLTEIATHIAGIAIDRQRQQEVLRERDARINLAAESADLAFWVLYPEQGTAWMSDKGRRIYGFDSNLPLTCELILSRIHPDERAAVKAEYDRACALRGAFETEHRLLLPYGKTRWVIMRGRCLRDEHGNLLETIGVTLDVSPQKQAALHLQVQREEMAHRNRVALMGEMTASFAHELNQPLTAIANNASAARRFLEHGNTDPVLLQELLQDMVADSQRAGEVIRGIRSLVRKETSVHTLLNLNSVITDTVRLVSSDVLNRESVVTTELDPHLPQVQAAF